MKRLGCAVCGRNLTNTEIALNLKLRGRAVSRFFCLSSLSRQMDCTEKELLDMAAFFRENGCELFSRQYVEERGEQQDVCMAVDTGA